MTGPFEINIGDWRIASMVGGLPNIYSDYAEHAVLCDEFDIKGSDGSICFLSAAQNQEFWPRVIVSQRFDPGPSAGFNPGALIVPSTATLFVGAGTRLLAYDLQDPSRKWEDYAEIGFWSWSRHGDFVVMAAELELAAFDLNGTKLWSRSVEPPWDYSVLDDKVHLDIMGEKSSFSLSTGPIDA